MAWNQEFSQGYESRKCRYRIIPYLRGIIFDLGCGSEKISSNAIGIDISGKVANFNLDLSDPNSLDIFAENSVDTVFSSHLLEDMFNTESVLKSWWRLVKVGGHLILYLPHKDFYPNIGKEGANPRHQKDFVPTDILKIMKKFASYKVISCREYNSKDEYSFELILKKKHQILKELKNIIDISDKDMRERAIVIRYGGMGDMITITPVLKKLHDEGYHVTVNTVPDHVCALDNNPNVDDVIIQEHDILPISYVGEYVEYLKTKYDRVINLCGSIEDKFLKNPRRFNGLYEMFKNVGKEKLDNVNYYDETLKASGFTDTGLNGELYLSDAEKESWEYFKKKNKDYFKILWCIKGSSSHKFCVDAEDIMVEMLSKHKDIKIYVVGGKETQAMELKEERLINWVGKRDFRTSIIMTKYVDLVISPETGVLNAAGCFSTPKIGLLTHSCKNNLTKYFENDYSVQSKAECSPCHKLVHDIDFCPLAKDYNIPICTTMFDKEEIIKNIEVVYGNKNRRQYK